ncbi:MAG: TauD/TfdA family dioxygenase [Methylobacteriaceae bacterium]|nr:TauD/TfdA family dioxygenase [Methylobacteriaceae bacterium]
MRNHRLDVSPTSGALSAFIEGSIYPSHRSRIRISADARALKREHGVIFFRDQKIAPEQHIAFARKLSVRIDVNRFFQAAPGYPQIAEVRRAGADDQYRRRLAYRPQLRPGARAGLDPARARDADRSGDTLFATMNRAYEALSDGMKKTLEGLRAVHSSRHVFGAASAYVKDPATAALTMQKTLRRTPSIPIVLRHPESSKKILYVNSAYDAYRGLVESRKRAAAQLPVQHAARRRFQYRFTWCREGSIAFLGQPFDLVLCCNDYHASAG